MVRSQWMLCGALALGSIVDLSPARADVPGPRSECDVEGLGCESCWQHYGSSIDSKASFDKCSQEKAGKALREACRHRQGAGDSVYFCPAGATPQIVTRGGCGGCGISSSGDSRSTALVALALGAALLRRRSRHRPHRF